MTDSTLIPVSHSELLAGEKTPTVSARDLHRFLEVSRDFSTWVKSRIEKYGFEDGVDYVLTLTKTGERNNVVLHEYHISLDMAKELSMVENNPKGRQARRYFIQCEKKARGDVQGKTANRVIETITELGEANTALSSELAELKEKYAALMEKYISRMEQASPIPAHYNRWLTKEEHQEIAKLYKSGLTMAEIQRKMKRSDHAVRSSLRSQNLVG